MIIGYPIIRMSSIKIVIEFVPYREQPMMLIEKNIQDKYTTSLITMYRILMIHFDLKKIGMSIMKLLLMMAEICIPCPIKKRMIF